MRINYNNNYNSIHSGLFCVSVKGQNFTAFQIENVTKRWQHAVWYTIVVLEV